MCIRDSTYNEVALHAGESSVASGIQQEIGGILDTIDRAFVTLHDGLLQDTALNVSAEILSLIHISMPVVRLSCKQGCKRAWGPAAFTAGPRTPCRKNMRS